MSHNNFADMIKQTKEQVSEVAADAIESKVGSDTVTFLDVREPDEWDGGIIPGAITLPRGFLELKVED